MVDIRTQSTNVPCQDQRINRQLGLLTYRSANRIDESSLDPPVMSFAFKEIARRCQRKTWDHLEAMMSSFYWFEYCPRSSETIHERQ